MKKTNPAYHPHAQYFQSDLSFKLEHLQLICLRYKHNKEKVSQLFEELHQEAMKKPKGIVYETDSVKSMNFLQYSKQLELDVDSFFIFSRIVLDDVPLVLKPLFKGIVTTNEPSTIDIKNHLEWFSKNIECVLDQFFFEKNEDFRAFFMTVLREPRNEMIVHPKNRHYRTTIDIDGNMKRHRYEYDEDDNIWRIKETFIIPDIVFLYNKIMEYLRFLNDFFIRKLD